MMKQQLKTEILVVGVGPAGSSAMYKAANSGIDVLGIDKRKIAGEPVQCAEYVPAPLNKYVMSDNVRVQSLSRMETVLDAGDTHFRHFPGVMINRGQFDRAILDKAVSAGAQVMMQCVLKNLDLSRKVAHVRYASQDVEIRFTVIIAADGPKSTVARRMKLAPLKLLQSRQYTVNLNNPSGTSKVWLSSRFPAGYGWLFPRGEQANLGVGFLTRHSTGLKQGLQLLHQRLVAQGLVKSQIINRTGGGIPISGLRSPLIYNGVMFAGDAAGLTHPITGAGIAPALYSGEQAGELAAEYVRTRDPGKLNQYAENVIDQYQQSMQRALRKRDSMTAYWLQNHRMDRAALRESWIAYPEYYTNG